MPQELTQYFKDATLTLERAQQLEIVSLLKPYIECGDIVEDIEVSQKYKKKTFVGVKLNHSNVDDILSQLKSETQIRAIELINDAGELTLIELKEEGISNAVVNNLVQKGFLEKSILKRREIRMRIKCSLKIRKRHCMMNSRVRITLLWQLLIKINQKHSCYMGLPEAVRQRYIFNSLKKCWTKGRTPSCSYLKLR